MPLWSTHLGVYAFRGRGEEGISPRPPECDYVSKGALQHLHGQIWHSRHGVWELQHQLRRTQDCVQGGHWCAFHPRTKIPVHRNCRKYRREHSFLWRNDQSRGWLEFKFIISIFFVGKLPSGQNRRARKPVLHSRKTRKPWRSPTTGWFF